MAWSWSEFCRRSFMFDTALCGVNLLNFHLTRIFPSYSSRSVHLSSSTFSIEHREVRWLRAHTHPRTHTPVQRVEWPGLPTSHGDHSDCRSIHRQFLILNPSSEPHPHPHGQVFLSARPSRALPACRAVLRRSVGPSILWQPAPFLPLSGGVEYVTT